MWRRKKAKNIQDKYLSSAVIIIISSDCLVNVSCVQIMLSFNKQKLLEANSSSSHNEWTVADQATCVWIAPIWCFWPKLRFLPCNNTIIDHKTAHELSSNDDKVRLAYRSFNWLSLWLLLYIILSLAVASSSSVMYRSLGDRKLQDAIYGESHIAMGDCMTCCRWYVVDCWENVLVVSKSRLTSIDSRRAVHYSVSSAGGTSSNITCVWPSSNHVPDTPATTIHVIMVIVELCNCFVCAI